MATQHPPASAPRPVAAPLTLDRTLSYRLHLLHKLTDMDSQHAYLREAGMSLGDGRCLATIGTFEPLSVKDLAQRANLDKGQASRAAQALVEQGLVSKQHDRLDARGVVLTLTEAGRNAFARTMDLVNRRNQQIFGCLNAEEQRTLSALFDRLLEHARQP